MQSQNVVVWDFDDTAWQMKFMLACWYYNVKQNYGLRRDQVEETVQLAWTSVKLEENIPGMSEDEASRLVTEFYEWLDFNRVQPVQGFTSAARHLAERDVIQLFATGNQHLPGVTILEWANGYAGRTAFTACYGTGLFGSKDATVGRICSQLAVDKANVVVVEDQATTAISLAEAGYRTLLTQTYLWGRLTEPHPLIHTVRGVPYVLPRLVDLLELN